MEKSHISSFKSTVWGQVTFDTIKQTPIYKEYLNDTSKYEEHNIIKAALYQLGYDYSPDKSYSRTLKNVVRSSKDTTKAVYADIFSFPVRRNHKLESLYEKHDLINIQAEDNNEVINLAEFGLEYYDTLIAKQNKKKTREEFIDELVEKSKSHDVDSSEIGEV